MVAAFFAVAGASAAFTQTLARPGLVGSGLNTDPWWKAAVFFDIRSLGGDYPGFKAITARLDAIQNLGVDALIVPMPKLPAQPSPLAADRPPGPNETAAPAPEAAIDDFDELVHEASRRNLRVLLNIAPYDPSGEAFTLTSAARFWLSHGIAGFRLVSPQGASPQDSQTMLQQLRAITNSAIGQRIVIASYDPGQPAAAPAENTVIRRAASSRGPAVPMGGPQLLVDGRIGLAGPPEAAKLRPLILQTLGQSNLMLDFRPAPGPPETASAAKAMATMLLATHAAGTIDSNQLPGLAPTIQAPDQDASGGPSPAKPFANAAAARPAAPAPRSLTVSAWYRELTALHHGNPAVRNGSETFLDFDAQNALVWVVRPGSGTGQSALNPPIVVACNLSAQPIRLSLTEPLKNLNLRGSFLRTVLRSDDGMGAQDLNSVVLPAYGVYIGELRR